MARSQDKDSGGSQFFIMVETVHDLDGDYAAFGRVIKGIDVVDSIANVKKDKNDKPIEDQIIQTITIRNADKIKDPEIITE